MLKNKSKILIFSLSILLIPFIAQGASLVMDCYATGNCGFCDALNLVTKIANYIIGLSGVAALLMFLYAGLTLITSKGNPNKITSATKIMINAVIGMFVIYIAWAGVNYLIYILTDGKQTGKGVSTVFSQSWQTFTCERKTVGDIVWKDVEQPTGGGGGGESSTAKLKEISYADLPVSCKAGYSATPTGSVFNRSSELNAVQNNDISPDLYVVLKCMYDLLVEKQIGYINSQNEASNLKAEEIVITSISDNYGIENCITGKYVKCTNANKPNCCSHTENSCHYGGKIDPSSTATPKSYAVDIRSINRTADENALIKQLIIKAGGNYYDETNIRGVVPHHHMSVSACSGS